MLLIASNPTVELEAFRRFSARLARRTAPALPARSWGYSFAPFSIVADGFCKKQGRKCVLLNWPQPIFWIQEFQGIYVTKSPTNS